MVLNGVVIFACVMQVLQNDIDLLNPPAELEKLKHKKPRPVPQLLHGRQVPGLLQHPPTSFLQTMKEYVRDAPAMKDKIYKADFSCPSWFSTSAKKLIKKILDPNPKTRITIAEVINNEWFKKGYQPPRFQTADVNLGDINSIFNETGNPAQLVVERREERPAVMNTFELISTSQGLNLGTLFEKQKGPMKKETRFASRLPANEILSKIEAAAGPMGFNVQKRNNKRVSTDRRSKKPVSGGYPTTDWRFVTPVSGGWSPLICAASARGFPLLT